MLASPFTQGSCMSKEYYDQYEHQMVEDCLNAHFNFGMQIIPTFSNKRKGNGRHLWVKVNGKKYDMIEQADVGIFALLMPHMVDRGVSLTRIAEVDEARNIVYTEIAWDLLDRENTTTQTRALWDAYFSDSGGTGDHEKINEYRRAGYAFMPFLMKGKF